MKNGSGLLIFPVGRKLMGATIAYLIGVWSCAVFSIDWRTSLLLFAVLLVAGIERMNKRKGAYHLFLLCLLAAGCAAGVFNMSIADMPTKPNTPISGTITKIESDYRVVLDRVSLPDGQETSRPVIVTLMTKENEPAPQPPKVGQRISGTGRLFSQDEVRNPDGTDDRIRALSNGYELSGYILPGWTAEGQARFSLSEWFRQLRFDLNERLKMLFGEHASLFAAIMLGERREIDAEMTAAMRLTGTAHILSVSGMHLSMISAAIYALLRLLPLPRRISHTIHVAALLMFTGLTGCAVGTIRALIMALMSLYAKARGLRYDRLTALSFAALVITMVNPLKAFDAGFQFSFFVVLGIALLEKPIARFSLMRILHRRMAPLAEMLTISLSAQIAAVPLQLSLYGYVPLLALPMNLFCAMIMPLLMTGGWCLLLFSAISLSAACICADMMGQAAALFESISLYASQLDWSILRLPAPTPLSLLLCGVLMMLLSVVIRFGRLRRAAIAAVLLVITALYLPRFDPAARYVQLDVGQGDASLIRRGRRAVLIDVGPQSSYDMIRYLRHEGLFVDAVILSHLDEDHAGALKALLSSEIDIGRVIMAKGAEDEVSSLAVIEGIDLLKDMGVRAEHIEAGDTVSAGGIELLALSPDDSLRGSNERSLLLYANVSDKTLLLAGDLPEESEPDVIPDCDVLKVAHHGSRYATSQAFLSMAQPGLAIISVGASNRYGHPHERVLEDLDAIGAQVLRTDQSGCVTVYLDKESPEVRTMLEPDSRKSGRLPRIYRQSTNKGAEQ